MSSWFKKPVNIIITIIAGVLLVTAATLIILKVSTRNLDEEAPPLMVCWANDQAYYVGGIDEDEGDQDADESACEGPQELVWSGADLPLAIKTTSPTGQDVGEGSAAWRVVTRAISDLNSQAGCELGRAVSQSSRSYNAEIQWGTAIEVGETSGSNPLGTCAHRGQGAPVEGIVTVRGGLSDRLAYLVVLHELGHLFGLGHNSFRGSVMFPLTIDDTEMDSMSGGRFSDGSIARLRRNYCSQ